MQKVSLASFVLAFTALLGTAATLSAQDGSGGIRGKVLDPSGALIPQAQITVSNAEGFSHTYESDADGRFSASELAPGSYSVSISATGFTPALESIKVSSDSVTREDVHLGISVDQEIDVFAQ